MAKKRFPSDLSLTQVFAAAFAAVAAAWLLSTLGVAGTLIGAAVGSVTATVSAAFVKHGLDSGRDYVVVSDGKDGVTVEERPADEVDPLTRSPKPWFNWRAVGVASLAALVIGVGAIIAYELISGQTFGDPQNSKIVPGIQQTTGPDGGATEIPSQTPSPTHSATTPTETPTTAAPTTMPTTAAPTTPAPAPAATGAPTPAAP